MNIMATKSLFASKNIYYKKALHSYQDLNILLE